MRMRIRTYAASLLGIVVLAGYASAGQTVRRAPRARPATVQIVVRNQGGSGLGNVHVTISGNTNREVTTDGTGTARIDQLPAGSYRLRFERDGYITLERDLTMKTGQPADVEVALS